MKRLLIAIVCVAVALSATAAPKKKTEVDYVDATKLTMIGKLCETENPYHRVDVTNLDGLANNEKRLLKMSSGLACSEKFPEKPTLSSKCPRNMGTSLLSVK